MVTPKLSREPRIERTADESRQQLIEMAAADHSVLRQAIQVFHRLMDGTDDDLEEAQLVMVIKELFVEVLADHFDREEDELFPSLLSNGSSAKARQEIFELCDDHRRLLKEGRVISRRLAAIGFKRANKEFHSRCLRFIRDLKTHSRKEERLIRLLAEAGD